jgi:hypothetical protein
MNNTNKLKYATFLLLVLFFSFSTLAIDYTTEAYDQGSTINLQTVCKIQNTLCDQFANCTLTIFYPNTSIMLDQVTMLWGNEYFYTVVTDTVTLGNYNGFSKCSYGNLSQLTKFNYNIIPKNDYTLSGTMLFLFAILFVLFLGLNAIGFAFKQPIFAILGSGIGLILGFVLITSKAMTGSTAIGIVIMIGSVVILFVAGKMKTDS